MPSSRTPTIYNIILVTAGVEQNQVLVTVDQPTIKKILVKSRTSNDLRFSWASGGTYVTIPAGQTYWDDELELWDKTLYLVGTLNGQVAEIQVWV